MLTQKGFLLIILTIFFLSISPVHAQTDSTGPVDYETLFKENLTRGGKVLNLSGKKIGDAGLKVLLNQDFIKNLKKLDLRYNQISPQGAKTLAQSPPLAKLKTLILKQHIPLSKK